jgi:hypothetical protein
VTDEQLTLPGKMVAISHALVGAQLPHAFGGALALAFCTRDARGTHDIDLNVLVEVEHADRVLQALPPQVTVEDRDRALLRREGQVRLWWGPHPLDLFLDTTEFHAELPVRTRLERFHGAELPFLGCDDLAVFKAFFSRSKDWVDIEEMLRAGTLDVDRVLGVLVRHLGGEDPRIERLRALATTAEA